ncbi:MAG TPA: DUF5916 domain-containing protein [Terriglobales bacterium]|nr:DUF5916 domain-containing protein [Terriglobales bacterium]
MLLLISTLGGTAAAAPVLDRATAAEVQRAPKIDGTLNDPLWATAPPIADLKQREPLEGTPASERTEVRILYDAKHIYFGIHCYDRDPAGIVATQLRRDLSMDLDDNFAIMIDPTLSRRNGYIFQVNPLGTQRDGEVVEEVAPQGDSIVDPSWDGLWISAAAVTPDGWTATIEIPFSTLNFHGGAETAWGLNFRRFIRRKNEEDIWSGWRRVFGFWRISQSGTLSGLNEVKGGRLLVLKPYALLGGQSFEGQSTDALHRFGGDIKYGLTSTLVANATFNTDFADADVDQQQFNLTPFPIFIPEKRRFFLENSDVFEFLTWNHELLFFSRQIGIDPVSGQEVPLDFGGKVAGKAAGFDVGVMDVKTREQGPNPYANYSIVRVKRPLMPGSYVGFIATDKESGSALDPYNRSWGADAKFIFWKTLNLRGYYAKTYTRGLTGNNVAVGGRVTYANNWFNLYAGHGETQGNFNAEMGFIQRVDDKPSIVQATLTPRPHFAGLREVDIGATWDYHASGAGKLMSQEITPNIFAIFQNGATINAIPYDQLYQFLPAPLHLYKNFSVPAGGYRFVSHTLGVTSPGNHRVTYSGTVQWGDYYTGTLNSYGANAEYRPNAHLDLVLNDTLDHFRLPQGNFDIDLAGLQVSYAFNRFLNATTFVQTNTADTKAVSVNFRVRYTFRPDSDLYVIYNLGSRFQSLAAGNPMNLREQKFAVKITYSFIP